MNKGFSYWFTWVVYILMIVMAMIKATHNHYDQATYFLGFAILNYLILNNYQKQ